MNRSSAAGTFVWLVVLAAPPDVSGAGVGVPPVTLTTITRLGGLDDETLAVAAVTDQQRTLFAKALRKSLRRERPRLFTYRALWREMVERLGNLKASAADNTFDPCEFVTDEAIEKAEAVVKEARGRFEDHCRKIADEAEPILTPSQWRLVVRARTNVEIPSPFRWLELSPPIRERVLRLVRIHEARRELARKYPHLKGKVSRAALNARIEKILSAAARKDLRRLRGRRATRPATRPGTGGAK